MADWFKRLAEICRSLSGRVVLVTRLLRVVRPLLLRVSQMVARWRLWRGARRRPRITRQWLGQVRLDLEYSPRYGYRLVAWAILELRGGVRAAHHTWSFNVPKKPAAPAPGGDAPRQAAPRPKVLDRTPVLASFLLDMQYEDGAGAREPSYLILRAAGGEWLATLKDPTEARQLRLRVSDLGTVYAALEALLSGETCPWEPDLWANQKAGSRRRKGG